METRRSRAVAVLALTLSLGVAGPLSGQENGRGTSELRLLQEASSREQAGDLTGAEAVLREALEANPVSLTALLSLERLTRMRGHVEEVLPVLDEHLKADPGSAIGHQMRVRAYSTLERPDEIEKAGDAWIRATPTVETPYREIARVWEQRGDLERAIRVLERGRDRLGADALGLELGDVYARKGEHERAVREWSRAVGSDAGGLNLVRRRLGAQPDGGAGVLPPLIDALVAEPATPARRRAAIGLAVDAGLGPKAEQIARDAAARTTGAARRDLLVEVARGADGAGLTRLAYWAYDEILAMGEAEDPASTSQMLAIRSRVAELALAVGDTARARAAYAVLEGAYAAGTPERRRATALRIELTAREGKAEAAERELQQFRASYPEAPELDVLAAAVAEAALLRGDVASAQRVLAGVGGPRSSLLRGRIALQEGDVAGARAAMLSAAPGLTGAQATRTIELVTLLKRLSPDGGRLVGRAMGRSAEGDTSGAVRLLSGHEAAGLGESERAALLDFAAGLARDAGLEVEASALLRRIVAEYPRTQEAPAALLALSRRLAAGGSDQAEARQLLERLILEHPRSALVPQARRELDRLDRRVPGS